RSASPYAIQLSNKYPTQIKRIAKRKWTFFSFIPVLSKIRIMTATNPIYTALATKLLTFAKKSVGYF
ncbi:hypothetical protein ABEV04_14870, partial [Heyndrickxia faecalis]